MANSLRVLVLEDRTTDAELIILELYRAGMLVEWKRVDTEADYLAQLDPTLDLILADYNLPQFDAMRALQILKARAWDIPFIVVTGTVSEEIAVECVRQGAADYLIKDRLARLGPAVKRALDEKKIRDEKQRAEVALLASEDRFRTAFDHGLIGMAMVDANGHFLQVNPALCQMLGYNAPELLGKSFQDVTLPEDRPIGGNALKQLATGEISTASFEKRYLRKDGGIVWVQVGVAAIRDAQNKLLYFVSQLVDITERKRAAEILRESEEKYHHISAAISDLAYSCQIGTDGNYEISWLMGAGERITGYTLEEIQARRCWRFLVMEEDLPLFDKHVVGLAPGSSGYCELRLHHKNGGVIWVASFAECTAKVDSRSQHLYGGLLDITDRKRAAEALRESEEKFRSIAEQMTDAIFVTDAQGTITYISPAAEPTFGFATDEMITHNFTEFLPEADIEKAITAFSADIAHNTGSKNLELQMKRKDGSIFSGELNAAFYRNAGVTGTLGTIRDISERKHAEEALQESEEKFRLAFQTSPDAVNINRLEDGLYVEINEGFTQLTGFAREEAIGKTSAEIQIWHNPADRQELVRGLKEKGYYENLEAQFRRKDGSLTTALMSAHVISLHGVPHIISITRDISERKRMEETLRESEEKYRLISENAADVIWKLNPFSLKLTYVSPSVQKLRGYSSEEVLGQDLQDQLTPESYRTATEALSKNIAAFLAGDASARIQTIQIDQLHKDGSIVHTEIVASIITNDQGQPIEILGTTRDITARKHAEEALRESEEKLRTFFEQTAEAITLIDEQGNVIEWNRACELASGLKREQILGQPYWDIELHMLPPEQRTTEIQQRHKQMILDATKSGKSPLLNNIRVSELHAPDGQCRYIEQTIFPIKTQKGYRLGAITRDVTERKRAEEALRVSEERYRSLIENMSDIVMEFDLQGNYHYLSPNYTDLMGYTPDERSGHTAFDNVHPEDLPLVKKALEEGIPQGYAKAHYRVRHKNGEWRWVETSGKLYRAAEGSLRIISTLRDNTDRIHAEEALRESEEKYRKLFSEMSSGCALHEIICDNDGDAIDYITLEVNDAYELFLNVKRENTIGKKASEILPKEELQRWLDIFGVVALTGKSAHYEMYSPLNQKHFEGSAYSPEKGKFAVTFIDITARKQAEEALAESERQFRETLENIQLLGIGLDAEARIMFCNDYALQVTGWSRDEVMGKNCLEYFLPVDTRAPFAHDFAEMVRADAVPNYFEGTLITHTGTERMIRWNNTVQRDPLGRVTGLVSIGEDITEQKQRARELEAIVVVSSALRTAQRRDEILPIVLGKVLELLNANAAAFGVRDPATSESVMELGHGAWAPMTGVRFPPQSGIIGHVLTTGESYRTNDVRTDSLVYRPDFYQGFHATASVPLSAQGVLIGALTVARVKPITDSEMRIFTAIADIAANALHRVTLYEQTEQRLERLIALRTVDQAITSSLDLRVTFEVLLEQILRQLHIDAADFLLYKPHLQSLEYAASRGFRTKGIERSNLRLGTDLAGRAALARHTIVARDLMQAKDLTRASLLSGEKFVSSVAVPLLAKGNVQGVLEIFQRSPLEPDPEWLEFLETLAGQAAIAVDNTQLFNNLQQSNLGLVLAYDATIEGWSRALDLRDEDTEGHTQRVVEHTLELARRLGFNEKDLVHVRRGALLHDIGKMGVPDAILHKPGALSDDEWIIMRKHPEYAYKLLSPITYLRPAIDIPYCHHEKWDGTGYPRKLKGEQIPLAARVFAVVDVWDALTSDRPYRAAWPEEKARTHIREQAGKHFELRIVETFLNLLKQE